MNANTPAVRAHADCTVRFAAAKIGTEQASNGLRVALPVLAGAAEACLLEDASGPMLADGWTLYRAGACLAGFATAAAGADLERATDELYQRLFALTAGLHLYRVWNYVPHINALTRGVEAYHGFCSGRSRAFEREFGSEFQRVLPAASAVGSHGGPLSVAFLAGSAPPQHFENPAQTPAFKYPVQYGPRPPSFSRATAVTLGPERHVFISGTSAIRGHASLAVGSFDGQLGYTLENLALIRDTAGAGELTGGSSSWRRALKVFLRRPEDLRPARVRLERDLLRDGDTVSYLNADICRSNLLVEIEETLVSGA